MTGNGTTNKILLVRLISDEIRTHLGRNICTESSRSHVRTLKTKLIIRDLMDTLEEPYVFLCLLVKTGSERKDRRKKEKKKSNNNAMLVMHSQTFCLLRQSNSPVVDATSVFGVLFSAGYLFSVSIIKGDNIE